MSIAGPHGYRATYLRRQADKLTEEAQSLRDEADEADKEVAKLDLEADVAELDDADRAWAELRAARMDKRQKAMAL